LALRDEFERSVALRYAAPSVPTQQDHLGLMIWLAGLSVLKGFLQPTTASDQV
jgi:hypothetical protein